jgi:16S rRNA processing protein RimM
MRWIEIGQVVKSHGLAGRVKVLSYLESDRMLPSLKDAWIGRTRDSAKRYPIENVRPAGRNHFSLKLEGIEDRSAADALKGFSVSVPYESLETLPENEYYWEDLIGLAVVTEDGKTLGRIENIFPTGSNDVFVCREGGREILLPAIAEVIRSVDIQAGTVVVRLLKGLELDDDAL